MYHSSDFFFSYLGLPSVSPRSAALCRSSECSCWWLGFPIIPSLRISSSVSCSSILWTCTDTQTDRVTFVNDGLRVHVLITPRLPCHEITWSLVLFGFMSQLGSLNNQEFLPQYCVGRMSKVKRCVERISGHPPSLPVAGGLSWWIVASRNPSIPNWTVGCSSEETIFPTYFSLEELLFSTYLSTAPLRSKKTMSKIPLTSCWDSLKSFQHTSHGGTLVFNTPRNTEKNFIFYSRFKLGSTLLVWYKDSNQQPIPKGMGLSLEIELRPVLLLR